MSTKSSKSPQQIGVTRETSAQPGPRYTLWLLSLVGAVVMSQYYRSMPVATVTDSAYSLLIAERWLAGQGPGLDDVIAQSPNLAAFPQWPYQARPGYPRVLQVHDQPTPTGIVTPWYPVAPTWLAAGWLGVRKLFGPASVFLFDGTYSADREELLQRELAGDVTAAAAVVLLWTASLFLPLWQALLLTIAVGVGSPLLSSASRAAWSQTWGVLIGTLVVYEIARSVQKQQVVRWFWLGTLCTWMYFCRPALLSQIAAAGCFVLWHDRRAALRMTAVGLGWGGLWLAWNQWQLHEAIPNYYRHASLLIDNWWNAFEGLLISPSRGLFVFLPWLVPALLVLLAVWQRMASRLLVVTSLCAVCLHIALLTLYPNWWGGFSYGPRLMLDAQPMLQLLVILAVAALPALPKPGRRATVLTLTATFLAAHWIHERGARLDATFNWNKRPVPIDEDRMRIFDWSRAQFLYGVVPWPLPEPLLPLPAEPLRLGAPEAGPYLLEGWSQAEVAHRWTDENMARLAWFDPYGGRSQLALQFRVMQLPPNPKIRRGQRVRIRVQAGNDGPLLGTLSTDISSEQWTERHVDLADAPPGPRVVTFELPDAIAPFHVFGRGDRRALGLAVTSLAQLPQGPLPASP